MRCKHFVFKSDARQNFWLKDWFWFCFLPFTWKVTPAASVGNNFFEGQTDLVGIGNRIYCQTMTCLSNTNRLLRKLTLRWIILKIYPNLIPCQPLPHPKALEMYIVSLLHCKSIDFPITSPSKMYLTLILCRRLPSLEALEKYAQTQYIANVSPIQ